MAFPVGSGHTVYGSRTIAENQTINQAPTGTLGQLEQIFSRSDQLFVPNTAGTYIATGVTKSDLSKLRQADLTTPGAIKFIHVDTAKNILAAAGLPGAHIAAMRPDHAIRLATYLSANGPHAATLLALENAAAAGHWDGNLNVQILKHASANPQLTDKLIQLAGDEHAGNCRAGSTSYMIGCAAQDSRLVDLKGCPGRLPDAVALGFEPKMHVRLNADDYRGLKALVQQHQNAYGTFQEVHFDDRAHRIDFGYGIEELEAMERGKLPNALNGNPPVTPNWQGFKDLNKIMTYFERSPDFRDGAQGPHHHVLDSFANPTYLQQRQAGRFEAQAGVFESFEAFDYTNYDTDVTPVVENQIQQFANNNTHAQLVSEILTNQDFPGIALNEAHPEAEGKHFLTAQMGNLFNAGVRVIGLEHLNVSGLQEQVDAFLDPTHVGPMPERLLATLRGLAPDADKNCLIAVIQAAKAHPPMQVVAINAENLRPPHNGADMMAMRDGMMNAVGKEALDARLQNAALTHPNPKFALLVGGAHNKAHQGLVSNGIPGFSQMYGVPTLHMEPLQPPNVEHPITVVSDVAGNRNGNAPALPPLNATRLMRDSATGKGQAIYQNIGDWAQNALEHRLFNATSTDQEAIKDLLHFGFFQRGDTTVDSRLQIRTVLTLGLARGTSIDDLRALRQVMEQADPTTFAVVLNKLNQEGVLFGEAISGLLDPQAANARETFQSLRPLLTTGPRDATKANSNVYADGNIALKRDVNGDLQIANVDVAFARFDVPVSNRNLSQQQVTDIMRVFSELSSTKYSSATVMLDFMEYYRGLRLNDPTMTVSRAFASFTPDGMASLDKYDRGDCIGVAEKLVHELHDQFGIEAHIAGANNTGLTKQRAGWPGGGPDYQPPGIKDHTGLITHVEVLVPYTDQQGQEKMLGFTPGGGFKAKYIRTGDLTPESVQHETEQRLGAPLRLRVDPDGGSLDGAEIQKAQLSFRTNFNLFNNDPTQNQAANKDVSYVNLLEGKISLSTTLSDKLRLTTGFPFDVGNGELSFNYRDALNNPNQIINVTDNGHNYQLTKLESLELFLDIVAEHSGQDDEFFYNTMTLLTHDREYCDAILSPDIAGLTKFNVPRQDAIANQPLPTDLVRHAQWDGLMQQARAAIDIGQYDQAVGYYNQAAAV